LKRVAKELNKNAVSRAEYDEKGKYGTTHI